MQTCTLYQNPGKKPPAARRSHLSLQASCSGETRRALSNMSKNNHDNDDWVEYLGRRFRMMGLVEHVKKRSRDQWIFITDACQNDFERGFK